MTEPALATLFSPYERGAIDLPRRGERVLFMGAAPGLRPPADFEADLTLVQGFRPDFLTLQRSGFRVEPAAAGDGYDAALVLTGRHRALAETRLAEALRRVRPSGTIVVAGGRTEGAASLRKRVAGLLPLEGHAARHHGVVFWLTRPDAIPDGVTEALEERRNAGADGFETAPGGFSRDRIDPGSRLLAENLPPGLSGAAADFGAGWGYLSAELAARFPGVDSVELYEADFDSLEAARRNLAEAGRGMRFHWHDLLSEPVGRRFDVIVMNPPFHHGRAAEPGMGMGMAKAALAVLERGGRLFLVANRALPYEQVLAGAGVAHGEVARNEAFKVLWARA